MQPTASSKPSNLKAYRGSILHCLKDPGESRDENAIEYLEDGLLLCENGKVLRTGPAAELLAGLPENTDINDYSGKLIVPGFIDTHIHYPQTDIIGSYGEQLLQWLEHYTFPAERRFEDPTHAQEVADFFIRELLRNGTTSAQVLATVHPTSVDAIFNSAQQYNMRLLAGKVLMDRNAPDFLRDTPQTGYDDSKTLIERWHGNQRLGYSITPRFAPTSSEQQLQLAGDLAREFPDVFIHTHVAENRDEVAWVAKLFPWSRSYLDVYDHFGLLRERSVFAHCLHLDSTDLARIAETDASMAFCPTSNLFLGSGLFDLDGARERGIRVGLATDVGGGTSFSMLQTANEAYKVLQLNGQTLSPFRALYLITLGGAEALHMDDQVGNFLPGKEADFVVLDPRATPLMARRTDNSRSIAEKLFAMIILADDRSVAATYLMGEPAYEKP
ncbi:MAG: guanine deaminase [Gammaproteobacteria bacterium]|nr:guanine deaminase [Gammaproteobacteria bacterium]